MVSGKISKSKTVNTDDVDSRGVNKSEKPRKCFPWFLMGLIFVTVLVVVILAWAIGTSLTVKRGDDIELIGECPALGGGVVNGRDCLSGAEVKKMDFQDVVDSWANSMGGKKGLIIYDLMAGEVVGEYNADEKFATASLYKLFVVYAGYLKVTNGEWAMEDKVRGTEHTVGECLDLAIRESHSECAEALWGMIGRDEFDALIQNDFGLPGVAVGSLSATPREIMQMMLRLYQRERIDDELAVGMLNSFLNQPITTYNWRQGLPSGFSDAVNVYNKVGWEYNPEEHSWLIYNDAAVVDFVDRERTFVIVVMTSEVNFNDVARFAGEFERSFRQQL